MVCRAGSAHRTASRANPLAACNRRIPSSLTSSLADETGNLSLRNLLTSRSDTMENQAFLEQLQNIANLVLVWVGFGTLVGLFAKAVMPGRDPGGAVATLAMGIAGTIIGCGIVSFFWKGHVVSPISPLGFCVATAGAFVLLFF